MELTWKELDYIRKNISTLPGDIAAQISSKLNKCQDDLEEVEEILHKTGKHDYYAVVKCVAEVKETEE